MTCGSCGAANEAGRKFCGQCGASLALECPSCVTANPPDDRFCGECGTPLVTTAQPAARAAPTPSAAPAAAHGRAHEAEPLLAEAHDIFERLEATPWIERLEAVSSGRVEVIA